MLVKDCKFRSLLCGKGYLTPQFLQSHWKDHPNIHVAAFYNNQGGLLSPRSHKDVKLP